MLLLAARCTVWHGRARPTKSSLTAQDDHGLRDDDSDDDREDENVHGCCFARDDDDQQASSFIIKLE